MKNLYIIGGTMGVGKTTVCVELNKVLESSVYLEGDWCWNSSPFIVTAETKEIVIDNITHILNNFIKSSAYKNIVFCWVMHEQSIIDEVTSRLDLEDCSTKFISLVCSEKSLIDRLQDDVAKGARAQEDIERSVKRIALYDTLNTVKIDTDNKLPAEVAENILKI